MKDGQGKGASEAERGVRGFHAHVYFDANEFEAAEALCLGAKEQFGLPMGRMHPGPVGPHPRGSCQLTVKAGAFGAVLAWLMTHRGNLTIFIHGLSGSDYRDHTRHVLWLGPPETLDISMFSPD